MAKHHRTPARSAEPVIEVKSKVSAGTGTGTGTAAGVAAAAGAGTGAARWVSLMLPVLQRRCPEPGAAAAESPRGAGAAGAGGGSSAGMRPVPRSRSPGALLPRVPPSRRCGAVPPAASRH